MQLDAQRCPPGTLGCVPPEDLAGFAEFQHPSVAAAVQPSVILGEDQRWRQVVADESGEDLLPAGALVFGDWQSAIRWKIEFNQRAAQVLIKVAGELTQTARLASLTLDALQQRTVSAETERTCRT